MRKTSNHPWNRLRGQFVNNPERSRSKTFAEFLATRPKAEAREIQAAEAAYLRRISDARTVPGAAQRDFQDSMQSVREGGPVLAFTA